MAQKSKPQRMCVGCREMKDKRSLIRIVKNSNGEIAIDPTGKLAGRGAYICPEADCLQKAIKTKGLERAFKAPVSEEVRQSLQERLANLPVSEGDDGV